MGKYLVVVVYRDGSTGKYYFDSLKQTKAIYKMYQSDMDLLNVHSVNWTIHASCRLL
jgi:hypothetical protein